MIIGKSFEYDYPHDIVSINDLSFYTTLPASNNVATLIMPFVSDSGRDGVLLDIRNLGALFKEFGRPNFKRHGQPFYNVVKTLEAGGRVYGMRITDATAAYANAIISLHLKIADVQRTNENGDPLFIAPDGSLTTDDNAGSNEAAMMKQITSKPVATNITGVTSDAINTILSDMVSKIEDDASGYTVFPLFAVVSKGRGKYGNNISARLGTRNDINDVTEFTNYSMEVLKKQDGETTIDGPYHVSFDEDARYSEMSIFADKVVNKFGTYADVVTCSDGYDKMLEFIQAVADENSIEPAEIELLVKDVTSEVEYVKFDTAASDYINLNSATGVQLTRGTDGAWSGKFDFTSDTRAKMDERFQKFYTGELDKTVLNTMKILPNYTLDADMPTVVKNAAATLAAKRIDMVAILDSGRKSTVSEVVSWKQSQTVDTRYAAYVSQWYMAYDEYSDKEIPVTATHQYALKLPAHFSLGRKHKPLAGLTYGVCSGITPNTLKPSPDSPDEFSALNKNKLNYICEVDGKLIINNQITSQTGMSALSELNNVMMLCEITSKIMRTVPLYRWEFSTETDIAKFIKMGNEAIRSYKSKVQYLAYRITQTEYEKEQNILRSFIDVQFNPLVKKNAVEINVYPATAAL